VLVLSPTAAGTDQFTFWANETIIATPSRTYTAWDVSRMLTDMGQADAVPLYEAIKARGILTNLKAPGVNTFVAAGTNIQTARTLVTSCEARVACHLNVALCVPSHCHRRVTLERSIV
jgi:hypothetical protein